MSRSAMLWILLVSLHGFARGQVASKIDRAYGANRPMEGPGAALFGTEALTNAANFPNLRDTMMSHGTFELSPCGLQTPHWHNADEITYMTRGQGVAALSMDNGTLVMFRFQTGDAMVFPQGTLHWIFNDGEEDARFFSSYNNQHPTYQPVHKMVNPYPTRISAFTFNITEEAAQRAFTSSSPDSTLVPGCPGLDYSDWNILDGASTGYLFPLASTPEVGAVGNMGFVGGGTMQGDFYSYSSNAPTDGQLGEADGAGVWGSFAPLTFGVPSDTEAQKYGASALILNGMQMTFGIIAFSTCGASVPHRHRNVDEMWHLLTGEGIVGHIAQNGTTYFYPIRAGDVGLFPRGTVHWLYNFRQDVNMTFISTWNNQKFVSQFLPWTMSVVSPSYSGIPTPIFQQAFNISAEVVEEALRGGDSTGGAGGPQNPVLSGTDGIPGCPQPDSDVFDGVLVDGYKAGFAFRPELPAKGPNGLSSAMVVGDFADAS